MKSLMSPARLRSALGARARKVTWLELFFDLIFVAAVAQVAEPLREHYSLGELVRLAPLLTLIWWAWIGNTVFATRFAAGDVTTRLVTLLQMFAVAAMAVNAKDALDSRSSAGLAAAYGVLRLVLVAQYFHARQVAGARPLAMRYFAGHGIAALIWIGSALAPAPLRFWLWGAAFAIDLGTPWLALHHTVAVPPDDAHLPERFGLFTLILLGDAVVGVMQGMETHEGWAPAAAVSAFMSMAVVFILWWWYFDGASGASERPFRSRGDAVRFHVWSYAHFPLYLGIIVAGVGLGRIVTAAARTDLSTGDVTILTGAVSVIMLSLAVIGATRPASHSEPSLDWLPHLGLTFLTAALALAVPMTSPLFLVLAVAGLCLAQLGIALSRPAARRRRVEMVGVPQE